MGVIAKYKFNNTLEANLLPEFNSEFTSDLYTVTDEVNGDITSRTIESDSLPTRMRFGATESSVATERSKSLLEIISLDISNSFILFLTSIPASSIFTKIDKQSLFVNMLFFLSFLKTNYF